MDRGLALAMLLSLGSGAGCELEDPQRPVFPDAQPIIDAWSAPDVYHRPDAGPPPPAFIDLSFHSVRSLATDATDLYFAVNRGAYLVHWIMKVDKILGGEPTMLDYERAAGDLAITGTHVYFVFYPPKDHARLARLPKGGGPREIVIERMEGLAGVDASGVYYYAYARDGLDGPLQVIRASHDGVTRTVVAGELPQYPPMAALAGDWVYFAAETPHVLYRVLKTGGPVETVLTGFEIAELAAGNDEMYLLVRPTESIDWYLGRIAFAGGLFELVAEVGSSEYFAKISADGDDVFWATYSAGELWHLAPGAEPAWLDDGTPNCLALFVDETAVFWATTDIYRLPR